ncbi:hypothetical protein D3C77_447650 [compost metagenome]
MRQAATKAAGSRNGSHRDGFIWFIAISLIFHRFSLIIIITINENRGSEHNFMIFNGRARLTNGSQGIILGFVNRNNYD